MVENDRLELLAEVAEMYYVQHLNQAAIAEKLYFSRSKVSRLLTEARESGLVDVTIRHPLRRDIGLEQQFLVRHQLKNCIILKTASQNIDHMLRSLGRLGAKYLTDNMTDGDTLGISWGTAVYEVAQAFRPKKLKNFSVVQIIGSIGYSDPAIDGPEVARLIASNFSGKYYTLSAPVIVKDKNTRDGLLKEPNLREVIQKANQSDFILAGIGSSFPGRSGIVRAGYLLENEMKIINAQTGAVGDLCANLFNQDGDYQEMEFNDRVVGISLDQIKSNSAEIIGIAGGEEKAAAILGALRGRLLDTLLMDDKAAEKVIEIDNSRN